MPKRKNRKAKPKFSVGSRVRVKSGVASPDYPDIPLGGWAGVIRRVSATFPRTYCIYWTEETLQSIPSVYRKRCDRDDIAWQEIWLGGEDLEPDRGEPLAMEQPTQLDTEPLSPDEPLDRVRAIFGLTSDDPLPEVNPQNQRIYREYLAARLSFPFECQCWHRGDSPKGTWHSLTVTGLREEHPIDETDGVMCQAREGDRAWELPLGELEVAEDNPNYEFVDDYAYWTSTSEDFAGPGDYEGDDEQEPEDDGQIGEDSEEDLGDWPEADKDEPAEDDYGPELPDELPPVPRLMKQQIVGRNDPCPCGSGKKYKKCCLNKRPDDRMEAIAESLAPVKPRGPLGYLADLPATLSKTAYQIKVTLLRTDPPVWRRVRLKDCTLETLHGILQRVMGWSDEHLYAFEVGGKRYSDSRVLSDSFLPCKHANSMTLSRIAQRGLSPFTYEYDFGDSWWHEITVEETLPAEETAGYPVCIAGERACPPEDCGGVWGYAEILEALREPDREENQERLEWLGEYDPEAFHPDEVNKWLQ